MELTPEQQEFKAKLKSIQYGKVPGGARDRAVAERKREKSWSKDMDAYAAMRKQGLQPQGIDGAHDLATVASDSWEVEHNVALSPELKKSHLSALKEAESGIEKAPAREWAPA